MKEIVIYYSWSGHTKALAQARAEKEDASICEVRDKIRPGTLKAYTAGCFAALGMKRTATQPMDVSLNDYGRILIMAPVWAGHPAPAIYAAFDALPPGKEVIVVMISASGSSSCREKVEKLVQSKGCTLAGFEDIKK